MKRLLTLLAVLFATLTAFAQGDSPYARFGYEGKVLRTSQERQQRMMLMVPNLDTMATVAKVGFDPAQQKYYLFDKQNQIITSDTLACTTVSRFLSVDPLTGSYPELTPYQFASNTPLWATDLDGLEAYYSNDGIFMRWGSDRSPKAPVFVVYNGNETRIALNYGQFLDRAHWIFGEGRGSFAGYYAHTMQNLKDWGNHGEGFSEDNLYKGMNDGTRVGKKDFFSGKSGVETYDNFTKFRNNPEALAKLPGATEAIEAVLDQQTGESTDPTPNATQWLGKPRKDGDKSYALKQQQYGADKVVRKQSSEGRHHIFYDNRNPKEVQNKSHKKNLDK